MFRSSLASWALIACGLMGCVSIASAADKAPASVADALKVFDPAKLPLLLEKDAEPPRSLVGGFTHLSPASIQDAYKHYQQKLIGLKWKELPNSYLSEFACSGTFSQADFLISISTTAGSKPNTTMVILTNHGNVALKKLPIPKGATSLFSFPQSEAVTTGLARDVAAAEVDKSLRALKWEPYGIAGDVMFFKQQAIRLSAQVMVAPAQGNKTVITYSSEQLSADLPVPPEAGQVQYSDSTTTVSFDIVATELDVMKFYNETFGKRGWKPTLEKPILIGIRDVVIYRNPAKELMELAMQQVDDKLRASVLYRSAPEEAALEAYMAEKAAEKKNAPKPDNTLPTLAIELPDEAKKINAGKREIGFNIADGKSKPYAESLVKKLTSNGWKEKENKLEANFGLVLLENGTQELTINYLETGVIPAEFTITSRGVELQQATKNKPAK